MVTFWLFRQGFKRNDCILFRGIMTPIPPKNLKEASPRIVASFCLWVVISMTLVHVMLPVMHVVHEASCL